MSRVRTTIWTTAFSTSALVSAGLCADTTEAEIRRLQQELNQLKASLSQDAPTRPPSNDPQWPSFAVFGKVSVDGEANEALLSEAADDLIAEATRLV